MGVQFKNGAVTTRENEIMKQSLGICIFIFFISVLCAYAQEPPYFVAYSHDLEEPGNLEIAVKSANGSPKNGNPFVSETMELEYGANRLVDDRSLSGRPAHIER